MNKFDTVFVVTHIAYRKDLPIMPIEGPYSSIIKSLGKIVKNVVLFGIPLNGFENEVIWGELGKTKNIYLPKILGKINPIKFLVDIILIVFALLAWIFKTRSQKRLVIGIDPLSCLPLLLFKNIFGYTLVFHCVDFNKNRFSNKILQQLYELADEFASKYSDQTWVICDALKKYKKNKYGLIAQYLPNSVVFDPNIFKNGKDYRTGNKMVWTGSLMTARQFDILFGVFSLIQHEIRGINFVIAPTREHGKFDEYVKKYKIKNAKVIRLNGRYEFQKIAAKCDVGIALYDEQFGSTEFIEPMKIWDFLLCGLPFIVSCEPSVSRPVIKSGVAYFMDPKNTVFDIEKLRSFLDKKNLARKNQKCLDLAKRFDIDRQIKIRLQMLLSDINKATK